MTKQACDKYINFLKPGGILIVDESIENKLEREDIKIYSIPILHTAANKLGKAMVANIVALGSIYQITKIVSKDALENAVLKRVPAGTEELNKSIRGRD